MLINIKNKGTFLFISFFLMCSDISVSNESLLDQHALKGFLKSQTIQYGGETYHTYFIYEDGRLVKGIDSLYGNKTYPQFLSYENDQLSELRSLIVDSILGVVDTVVFSFIYEDSRLSCVTRRSFQSNDTFYQLRWFEDCIYIKIKPIDFIDTISLDSNGNVVRGTRQLSQPYHSFLFKYDKYKNPFYGFPLGYCILNEFPIGKNNITKEFKYDTLLSNDYYSYEYTYDDGFPVFLIKYRIEVIPEEITYNGSTEQWDTIHAVNDTLSRAEYIFQYFE